MKLFRLVPVVLVLLAPVLPASEAAERLVLATYKLANSASTATGLAISHAKNESPARLFIVTARHVFDKMEGDRFQLVGRTRKDDGTYRRNEHEIVVREEGRSLWINHPKHDLAILPLPADLGLEALPLASLAVEARLQKVHTGDSVRLAVFPERSEANGAGFPILRNGTIASYPFLPYEKHHLFLVDATAWPGDSGGPVMHAGLTAPGGSPLVIGFVRGMRNITDTEKESRYVERKVNYPLAVSEVVHAIFARDLITKAAEQD